jgi:hypothetical protein
MCEGTKSVSAEAILDLSQRAVAALERIATKLEEIAPSTSTNMPSAPLCPECGKHLQMVCMNRKCDMSPID